MTPTTSRTHRLTAGALVGLAAIVALGTAGTASADDVTQEVKYTLQAGASIEVNVACPASARYLVNRRYDGAKGRIVPAGIDIAENGGVGVNMHAVSNNSESWSTGATGSATNWQTSPQDLTIKAHCSNNPNDGYPMGNR
ncbi:hypothetical protein MINS_19620 [Mycolicibacterium insubricum]|jgi:hypothetical protein|uniref:Uncharacterized protein n=1 Tax=Mycolicibacterium insubricum TaxID=444597 RepID=A0A1X0DKI0_9MYCO|nr:hypothetical protein [Mycolicibacterium insubricum]MCB9440038.1 hypothetical protein [Mycolicibacterium sp.]MCV7082911.1 hypothetical protein [Mycolicibacterium insubricum]ORA72845.1 hypothetical protein BST26_04415 [Mycolicibacterium insubricum]BBZ66533.1 hypothetical protein MINS_19620 [Mycolicibacterium insubricum]